MKKKKISLRLPKKLVLHENKYSDKKLLEEVSEYDELVYKDSPIIVSKQRHVEKYGPAKKGLWSENIARQLSVPERLEFRNWLNKNGFDLK